MPVCLMQHYVECRKGLKEQICKQQLTSESLNLKLISSFYKTDNKYNFSMT